MNMISVYDSDTIMQEYWKWCTNESDKRQLISSRHEEFLHNIGYSSAVWQSGTFFHSVSKEDYTHFALRWL